jgi:hypothetical protein
MLNSVDTARIESLCPELREILKVELAAGNRVVETWDGWGLGVVLERPFLREHVIAGSRVAYHDVNDPHYWKAQYSVKELGQLVACRFSE